MASLAEGMAQALMQVKMMKRQDAERAVRDEYLKSQKKILDAQFKALDAENAWWDSQPQNIQKLRHLPKEMQMLGFMGMGLQPPPTVPGAEAGPKLNLQENMTPIPGAPGPGGAPTAPQGGGLPDVMSGLMLRGMMNKMLGFDPGEIQQLRGIAGPGGAPVTLPVNKATGFPMGPGMPEAVKPEGLEFTGPGGEKRKAFVNPYQPGEAQGMVTAPPEIEPIEYTANGVKYEQDVNKITRQPVGAPRVKQGMVGQTAYYKANIERVAIPSADNLVENLFDAKNGKLSLTFSGRMQGTFPDVSQKMGGEIANDAMKIAYALLRPETGAMINDQELMVKITQQLPKAFTSADYAVNNLLQIGEVIDSYLGSIDPDYEPQAEEIIQKALEKKAGGKVMTKPPKLGKQEADPLGIR